MKKNIIIIFCLAVVLIAAASFFISQNQKPLDPTKISDSQIISMIKENSNAQYYIQNHPDFVISKRQILTKQDILDGQNGSNFREVYLGLDLEDNRYMTINLMNKIATNGLIAVIDFKKKEAIRAYGVMLFKSSAPQNGQTSSATTNK